jgi:sporulation protein YlmC with PRC-barrel domain
MSHVRFLAAAALGAAMLSALPLAGVQAAQPGMTPGERHDWERTHRVSRIIGTDVRTKSGEKIGEIKDVVVDDKGVIRLAIVSTGGYLGVGERLHAVPWDAMALGPKDDRVVDIDKAHLREAPGFTSKSWPNLGDERWMADNRRYYVH